MSLVPEIKRRLLSGEAGADIGRALGVSRQRVHQIAARIGVVQHRESVVMEKIHARASNRKSDKQTAVACRVAERAWQHQELAAAVVRLRVSGLTYAAIGRELGISTVSACRIATTTCPHMRLRRPHGRNERRHCRSAIPDTNPTPPNTEMQKP